MTTIPVPYSPSFIRGFTERCMALGLTEEAACEHFAKFANCQLLTDGNIGESFAQALQAKSATVSTRHLMRVLNPDVLSAAVSLRVWHGDDPLSDAMRKAAGAPDPDAQTEWGKRDPQLTKIATTLSGMSNQFNQMPLNQKLLVAMMLGGLGGGAYRSAQPSDEDQAAGRGVANRFIRGAGRGAAVGAGAAAGSTLGAGLSDSIHASPDFRMLAAVLGGLGGGAVGNRMVDEGLGR